MVRDSLHVRYILARGIKSHEGAPHRQDAAGALADSNDERTESAVSSVQVELPVGRTDTDNFFTLSGYYREAKQWKQYPLLVFERLEDRVAVHILKSQSELRRSNLPDDTPCMQQWGGQWQSDFFTFSLGEARAALATK